MREFFHEGFSVIVGMWWEKLSHEGLKLLWWDKLSHEGLWWDKLCHEGLWWDKLCHEGLWWDKLIHQGLHFGGINKQNSQTLQRHYIHE